MYRIRKRRIRLVHGRCSSYGDSAGRFSAFFETIRLYVSGRRQRQKRFTDLRRTRTSRGIYYVRPFRTACPLRFRSSSRGPRSRSARFLPTLSHATCRFTCRKHNICTCTHTRSRTRTNSVYRKNRKRSISLRRRRRLSYTVPPSTLSLPRFEMNNTHLFVLLYFSNTKRLLRFYDFSRTDDDIGRIRNQLFQTTSGRRRDIGHRARSYRRFMFTRRARGAQNVSSHSFLEIRNIRLGKYMLYYTYV